MRDFTIEGANLLAPINVEGKTLRILKLIEKTFDVIQQVRVGRRTIGFTTTSKILHMSIPKFFVMCDEKIRKTYGCEGYATGYRNFVLRMSLLALPNSEEIEHCF
jgi:hypothetical protein